MNMHKLLSVAIITTALLTTTSCQSPMYELQQGSQEVFPRKTVKANFTKIKKGMGEAQVRKLLGYPTGSKFYQTGKAWIPFYFGPDTSRVEYSYEGVGYVTLSRNAYSGRLSVVTTGQR